MTIEKDNYSDEEDFCSQEQWESNLIPNSWPGNCFGCSPKNAIGLKMRVCATKNKCVSYLTISDNYCGFEGIAHGGIIATVLDEIAAWTLIVHLNNVGITQNAEITYLRAVKTNELIIAEGSIIERTPSSAISLALLKDTNGNVLAKCKSNWLLPSPEILAKVTKRPLDQIKTMLVAFKERRQ